MSNTPISIVLESEEVTEALVEYAGKRLDLPEGTELTGKLIVFPNNRTARVDFAPTHNKSGTLTGEKND